MYFVSVDRVQPALLEAVLDLCKPDDRRKRIKVTDAFLEQRLQLSKTHSHGHMLH